MQEHASDMMSAANDAANSKITAAVATSTAGGVIATGYNPTMFGHTLAECGVFGLSWVEIFQIIGTLFVAAQLLKMTISAYHTVSDYYAKRRR
jgi:hypothetical protein